MTANHTRSLRVTAVAFIALSASAGVASAALVPFTENFAAGPSDWRQADGITDLNWLPAGGPDGSSYGSGLFSFVAQGPGAQPAILRAHDEYGAAGASGGAFVGNWLADGATGFSAWVRHSAPMPLTFYARYASPTNSPGAASVQFAPVLPNTWTQLTFDLAFGTPNLFLEGAPSQTLYNSVFSNIGHVQIGAQVPDQLAGSPLTFSFDVDGVSLIPEPATASLVLLVAGAMLTRRRVRGGRQS